MSNIVESITLHVKEKFEKHGIYLLCTRTRVHSSADLDVYLWQINGQKRHIIKIYVVWNGGNLRVTCRGSSQPSLLYKYTNYELANPRFPENLLQDIDRCIKQEIGNE